jgi:hypothetical protein
MKEATKADAGQRVFVESLDGEAYGGESFSDVVGAMRESSWGGTQSDGIRGYMKQVAKRIWDWSQKRIRTSTPEMFIRDLEKEGVLKVRVRHE